ncbi:type VII secretion target [Streptomyces palmae]|uniref:Excreted virulence factor EspC (Type VII ESX diderm) n=1 Tax=Streptomyces palmae TaxID=1701085 RepID=A0A4Z0HDM4_9ACTN|nr:type VII secretion target [Streptomyces palmae]TGB16811.1 hypothetical protein E4099_04515 [Streptomyces palmae]
MSFEDEWARLKARQVVAAGGTRLDRVDGAPGPGGPQPRLKVTDSTLRARAEKAETVRGQFAKADDDVMKEMGEVPGTLKGFACDEAVTAFLERWKDQMAFVKDQFTGTAKALRTSADAFQAVDHWTPPTTGSGGSGGNQP